ncbi:BMP family protein [Ligilactobacillus sp. WILCCON 0076]|uniref:BMP family protein n=1 Tax=Ligilactobacillus ubinensis TaxID=2876789 RepID=A0A9X2JJY1_9LACO|nr:BMP family protein [Ligilactobacillus ubinensis]MCP0885853.1 BMP family protein [Ligilactobacillus ubinensis]
MKKRVAAMLAATVMLGTFLVGCGNSSSSSKGTKHTVAIVTDGGGIDDKSFNQSAWEGLKAWGKEHSLTKGINGYNYAQSSSDSDFSPNINKLIKAGYKTIVGTGYKLDSAITTAAKQNRKVNFVIIDSVIKQKNVASVMFKAEQSSFLAGVAAAETTKTNHVGFIGGVQSDVITAFEKGYIQGVHSVNPNIKVDVKYVGSFSEADVGQSLATAMYNSGADVIFHAAGGSGSGVFTAAKNLRKNGNKNVWVIGVDQDQKADGKYSGGNVTLASAVKEVGTAVKDLSNKAMKNKFPGGKTVYYDLKDNGVDLVNDNLSSKAWKAVKEYKQKIVNGDITVKDN